MKTKQIDKKAKKLKPFMAQAAAMIKTKAGDVAITIRIGTATGTGQSTVDRLIAAADAALYRAKAEGRNRVVSSALGVRSEE